MTRLIHGTDPISITEPCNVWLYFSHSKSKRQMAHDFLEARAQLATESFEVLNFTNLMSPYSSVEVKKSKSWKLLCGWLGRLWPVARHAGIFRGPRRQRVSSAHNPAKPFHYSPCLNARMPSATLFPPVTTSRDRCVPDLLVLWVPSLFTIGLFRSASVRHQAVTNMKARTSKWKLTVLTMTKM